MPKTVISKTPYNKSVSLPTFLCLGSRAARDTPDPLQKGPRQGCPAFSTHQDRAVRETLWTPWARALGKAWLPSWVPHVPRIAWGMKTDGVLRDFTAAGRCITWAVGTQSHRCKMEGSLRWMESACPAGTDVIKEKAPGEEPGMSPAAARGQEPEGTAGRGARRAEQASETQAKPPRVALDCS